MTDDTSPTDTKLTQSKKLWAGSGKFLTGAALPPESRLPPGQHLVTGWPVLDLGTQPEILPKDFRLEVSGRVALPLSLDHAAFAALEQSRMTSDIHCVTTWSRYDNDWTGVAVRDLLALADPLPDATHVMLHGLDGYTTNLPLADFAAPQAILATHWQGAPLTAAHGGPLRAVVPHLYFWKSAKWLCRIELMSGDRPGFWEQNGYHMYGDPWTEQRYGTPDETPR